MNQVWASTTVLPYREVDLEEKLLSMQLCLIFVIWMVIPGRSAEGEDRYLELPQGFKLGVGGSAYQTEGGWNASDKAESIWDRFAHTQSWKIANGSTGDIACDSYHKYREDVQSIKELGLDFYRFSISWSRLLPYGFANYTSLDGLRYYHSLIDELLANGIEPVVMMYHWDHPQILEDLGGWINESMVEWFADYANVIFREFGPKVKVFATINEPRIFCLHSYVSGAFAPGKQLNSSASYLCNHNTLKAHARAYHLYDEQYRSTQNGKIGITSVCQWFFPKTPNDTLAAEMALQFNCGTIFHPVFIGDYPEIVKTKFAEMSRAAGLSESMLPEFSAEWIEYIRGTSDYLGLNHYVSYLAEFGPQIEYDDRIDLPQELGINLSRDPSWESGAKNAPKVVPEGFGDLLRKIKKDYNNPPVYVLENGSRDDGTLNDYHRMRYYHLYLKELLLAVHRDGCNVQKYTFWSLMDNFEWFAGYDLHYGFIHVNFSSPDRERIPKLSCSWLKSVMRTRRLQPPIMPLVNSTLHP